MTMTTRQLLKTDGTITPLDKPLSIREIQRLIGRSELTTVNLRDGRVLFCDDLAYQRVPLPQINAEATRLYHSICRPGATWQILGDAVVTLDDDFGGDEP